MKALVQRVSRASVSVDDEVVSGVGRGLCVLVGICTSDTLDDCRYIVKKILGLKVFEDEAGKRWSKSVQDKQLEILCVSQFTLYGNLKKNKPDFHKAMAAEQSQIFYNHFLKELRDSYISEKIKDGVFGAYMQVQIQNDGPVTVQIESPPKDDTAALE